MTKKKPDGLPDNLTAALRRNVALRRTSARLTRHVAQVAASNADLKAEVQRAQYEVHQLKAAASRNRDLKRKLWETAAVATSHAGPADARVLRVIAIVTTEGMGQALLDPVRNVTTYWSEDGVLLARSDPWADNHLGAVREAAADANTVSLEASRQRPSDQINFEFLSDSEAGAAAGLWKGGMVSEDEAARLANEATSDLRTENARLRALVKP